MEGFLHVTVLPGEDNYVNVREKYLLSRDHNELNRLARVVCQELPQESEQRQNLQGLVRFHEYGRELLLHGPMTHEEFEEAVADFKHLREKVFDIIKKHGLKEALFRDIWDYNGLVRASAKYN